MIAMKLEDGDKLRLLCLVAVLYFCTVFGRLIGQINFVQLLTLLIAEFTLALTILKIPSKDDDDKGDD